MNKSNDARKLEEYVIQKRLAPALFGDVLLCKHKPTGDLVAVKRVLLSAATAQLTLSARKKVRENVALERVVYRQFQKHGGHPNVLALREEIQHDGYLYMVFDYCDKGELYELLSKSATSKLDEPTARKYLNQIVRGVQFMHATGFAHRDLSLENILVTKDDVCQVCDFGLAAPAHNTSKETVGKLFYMAPEVLAGDRYDPKQADVWSLGVMLFIMLIGAPPAESASLDDPRFRLITAHGVRHLIERWGLTRTVPPKAIDLLECLLQVDPARRPTIDQIVTHPFLRGNFQSPRELEVKNRQFSFSKLPIQEKEEKSHGVVNNTIQRLFRRRSSKRIIDFSQVSQEPAATAA